MTALITADLVDLDVPSADRKTAVTALAERLVRAGRVTDLDTFLADIEAREAQMPTGLEAASASRTAAPRPSPSRPWPSAGLRRVSTSAPRTAPPTSSS